MHRVIITTSTLNESNLWVSNTANRRKKGEKKNMKKPLNHSKENGTLLDCALIQYDHYSFLT